MNPGDSTTTHRAGQPHWNLPQRSWVKKGITPKLRMLLFLNTAINAAPFAMQLESGGREHKATI
ncbi:hypothetical protein M434DRAFT_26364 [Hypoxylon sp. CO27-5]|nr:hypothetical protein M434DRAFT_26364 [Hypoxylon sp. CO27-5]